MQRKNPASPQTPRRPGEESQDLSGLVELARDIGAPDKYAGKRNNTRFKVGERLDICTNPGDPSTAMVAILHNISEDGSAFWLKMEHEVGSKLYVRHFLPTGEGAWTPGEVRHCTRGIKGYLVGIRFLAHNK